MARPLTKGEIETFMLDTHKNLIDKTRKRFVELFPDTSADSKASDDSHILYLNAFLKHAAIKLDKDNDIRVKPLDWALAFLQQDLKSVTEVLCRALLTPEYLKQRSVNEPILGLSPVMTSAIKRAAVWLTNKNRDPWCYIPDDTGPTNEDCMVMDKVIATLNWTELCHCPSLNNRSRSSSLPLFRMNIDVVSEEENHWKECDAVDYTIQRCVEDHSFDEAYDTILKHLANNQDQLVVNAAQLAEVLTKITNPRNTDIIVDAVHFSKGRWDQATKYSTGEDVAWKLFKKSFKMDFIVLGNKFRSMNDVCSVTRVALYRAVAWITRKDIIKATPSDFNSAIKEHNCFPTPCELRQIDDHLTKMGLNEQRDYERELEPLPTSSITINSRMRNGTLRGMTATTTIKSQNASSLGTTRRRPITCIVSPSPSFPPELRIVEVGPNNSDMAMDTSSSMANGNALVSVVGTHESHQICYVNDNGKLVPVSNTVNLNPTGNLDCGQIDSSGNIQDLEPFVEIEGHKFKQNHWGKALQIFQKEAKDKTVKAGKSLVRSIFEGEMDKYTKCGRKRNGTEEKTVAVPQDKVDAILDGLEYMERNYNDSSIEFQPWKVSDRELLTTKVVVNTFNYYRVRNKRRQRACMKKCADAPDQRDTDWLV